MSQALTRHGWMRREAADIAAEPTTPSWMVTYTGTAPKRSSPVASGRTGVVRASSPDQEYRLDDSATRRAGVWDAPGAVPGRAGPRAGGAASRLMRRTRGQDGAVGGERSDRRAAGGDPAGREAATGRSA